MCCLGFYALALGNLIKDISCVISPGELLEYNKGYFPKWLVFREKWKCGEIQSTEDCKELMCTNDATELNDDSREQVIKEIFAKHDVEVEFID